MNHDLLTCRDRGPKNWWMPHKHILPMAVANISSCPCVMNDPLTQTFWNTLVSVSWIKSSVYINIYN